ncbi:MAG TPA: tetraacyldisaccharide 4'-kinase [Gemmatirosa sp.]
MSRDVWLERVWYGDGVGARAGRAALSPLSVAFGAITAARGRLYDAGVLRQHVLPASAISVGNLTVGGTGKTPIAAWIVAELVRRGTRPAVLLRGVGGDEARVHALLNPGVPVVADPDRVRGASEAVRRGADVLVLDDGFQHRRARRDADVVLVAAETFDGHARVLPAGPYREALRAARRATVVVVTRKSASRSRAELVASQIETLVSGAHVGLATVHLEPASLVAWRDELPDARAAARPVADISTLDGARVLAIAGVGAPHAFAAQLEAAGASVELARYADHHAYDEADVAALLARAERVDRVVTTLKDAVKLGPLWSRHARALWYVTQRVTLETGAPALVDVLDAIARVAHAAAARAPHGTVPDTADRGRHA